MVRLRLKPKIKAFSLLEVIITVAILSTGIVVILQALCFCARVTGLSCDITNAVFLAEDKLQELEFKESNNKLAEGQQESDKKDKFAWNYTIGSEPDSKLYKLDLDITWQRLNRQERLSLNTYLRK